MLTIQLVSKFIFYVGLHTKKSLRGNAIEWYDLLAPHIRTYASVRAWFARNILFNHPQRYKNKILSIIIYYIYYLYMVLGLLNICYNV